MMPAAARPPHLGDSATAPILEELQAAQALEVPLQQVLQQFAERLRSQLSLAIVGVWVLDDRQGVLGLQA
ncbi:MAG: hypothetical protein JNG84_10070, partial [Archangium sp.]|nr:hypothetical protein [Archangium sp.]